MEVETPPMRTLIRNDLEAKQDAWHDPLPGIYHAHTVWWCHRKNWFKRRGFPEEEDPPLGLFKMGHKAEDGVMDGLVHHFGWDFVRQNLTCDEGLTVKIAGDDYEYRIRGKTDPGVYGYNMVPKILYESKSKTGIGKGSVVANTGEHHKMQGSWYADRLGFPELRVVHPGRNDLLQMPDVDTVVDQREIKTRADIVREYFRRQFIMDMRQVPPPGRPFLKNECKYCPFTGLCDESGGPGTPIDPDSYKIQRPVEAIVEEDGGGEDSWIGDEEE